MVATRKQPPTSHADNPDTRVADQPATSDTGSPAVGMISQEASKIAILERQLAEMQASLQQAGVTTATNNGTCNPISRRQSITLPPPMQVSATFPNKVDSQDALGYYTVIMDKWKEEGTW